MVERDGGVSGVGPHRPVRPRRGEVSEEVGAGGGAVGSAGKGNGDVGVGRERVADGALGPGVGEYRVGASVGVGRRGEDGSVSAGVVFVDGSGVDNVGVFRDESGVVRRPTGRPVGGNLPGLPGVQVVADGSKKLPGTRKSRLRVRGRERLRVTQRDVELFKFLARYKYATVGQIARFFGTGVEVWQRRLPRLNRAGLVWWEWGAAARPKLWLVTREGLMFAGIELGLAKVSWGQLRHTLGLTDLGIGFERGAAGGDGSSGEVVVTERELRAAVSRKTLALRDGVGSGPTDRVGFALELFSEGWGARFGGVGTTGQLVRAGYTVPVGKKKVSPLGAGVGVSGSVLGHIPDMVILRRPLPNGQSGCLAVELELSRKTVPQYEKIIRAYTEWDGYSQAIYYCVDKGIARTLSSIIEMVPGARGKVLVMLFDPVEEAGMPGRTAASARLRPALYPRLKTGMLLPVVPEQDRLAGLWDATVGGEPPDESVGLGGAPGTSVVGVRFDDKEPFDQGVVGSGSGSGVPGSSPFARTTYDKLAMADKERDDTARELAAEVKAQVKREVLEEMRRKLEREGVGGLAMAVEEQSAAAAVEDEGWVEDESYLLEEEDEGEEEFGEEEEDEEEDEDEGGELVAVKEEFEDWDEDGNLRVRVDESGEGSTYQPVRSAQPQSFPRRPVRPSRPSRPSRPRRSGGAE